MRYAICCNVCQEIYWIRGDYDPQWDEVCDHIKAGGDFEVVDEEAIEWA